MRRLEAQMKNFGGKRIGKPHDTELLISGIASPNQKYKKNIFVYVDNHTIKTWMNNDLTNTSENMHN